MSKLKGAIAKEWLIILSICLLLSVTYGILYLTLGEPKSQYYTKEGQKLYEQIEKDEAARKKTGLEGALKRRSLRLNPKYNRLPNRLEKAWAIYYRKVFLIGLILYVVLLIIRSAAWSIKTVREKPLPSQGQGGVGGGPPGGDDV